MGTVGKYNPLNTTRSSASESGNDLEGNIKLDDSTQQ